MSKPECRMNDEIRRTKRAAPVYGLPIRVSSFGFHSSRRGRSSTFGFRHSSFLIALALLPCTISSATLTAASQPPSTAPAGEAASPLVTKQQIVRDRMSQLEDRMFRLIEQLSSKEPEQAARLETALKRARELLIRRSMDQTIRLLSDEDLAGASDKQIEIIRDLENVLKLLLEDPDSSRQRQEEIARLEAFQKEVARLLAAQEKLDAVSQAAAAQRALAGQTAQLAEKMSGNKTDTQPAQPPAPGGENVQRGGQHMSNAAGELEQQKIDQGRESQQQAAEELKRTLEILEKAIEQLKQEQRGQSIRQLQTLLQAMLDRQLKINEDTQVLDKKGRSALSHADELALTGLGRDQMDLADQNSEVLRLLKSDGTTLVFPQIIGQVRDDMERVAERLQKKDTGALTQRVQAGIAETLEQLVDSLKESAANPPPQAGGGGGSGGGQGGNPPLVPPSAELKLLRNCQKAVNQRTTAANESIEKNTAGQTDQQDELQRLTKQQNNLADLAGRIHKEWTQNNANDE
jgi:hypothetical protein